MKTFEDERHEFRFYVKSNGAMRPKQIKNSLRTSDLIIRFLRDKLTADERVELATWLNSDGRNKALLKRIFDEKLAQEDARMTGQFDTDEAFQRLMTNIKHAKAQPEAKVRSIRSYYKVAAAAAIIVIVLTAGLLILKYDTANKAMPVASTNSVKHTSSIVLTLSNGKQVDLEQQKQGVITSLGSAVISKDANGTLTYSSNNRSNDNISGFTVNKIDIPRGKRYELVLPDGSKVWLNSQTVLTFPTDFGPSERVVELSGEAYFEVQHMDNKPFKVRSRSQTVQVLGTHFNISAYPDDDRVVTTLTSGSVKVFDANSSCLLKPGQQAQKADASGGFDVSTADLNEVLGWKDGVLLFKDATIEELMQTVSRAFDVDVEVDPRVKGRHFGGSYLVRNGLHNLLRNLEQTEVVHFKINGRRVSVMP
ncbi:FecR domain-containing protein [Mucilaginibacter daejeonensis]|uniref:FecR family protein n=1 Tax=Mucilaginibacter daejeonensis TaxID=398049 RepID=UPI001D1748FB|nr:FecR domain-containing protein [Mucilaginibacter daejeonensis]UEG51355.1 FecR domain-containing protein [Mucilaginibacter daejeonensis]